MRDYPEKAGFTDLDTSLQAAVELESKGRAETLRALVLDVLKTGDFTADEIARKVGEDILSIRPRVTELFKQGKIIDSGIRRENSRSGKKAKVVRLPKGQLGLFQGKVNV